MEFRRTLYLLMVFIMASIDQTAGYLLVLAWKFNIGYFLLTILAVNLFLSIIVKDVKISLLIAISSLIAGGILSYGIMGLPQIIHGGIEIFGFIFQIYIQSIARLAFIGSPIGLFGVLVGSLISEGV